MSYRTPRAQASGFGSARDGVHHWWVQRVTAVALLPLAVLFAVPFATSVGGPYQEVLETYRNPFHAIVAVLFLAVAFYHLMLGLQVVIEDYVHHKFWRTALLLCNTMFCTACGLAGIFAVLKIAFSG